MKIDTGLPQLSRLFPSYIVLDSGFEIVDFGPSVRRHFPHLAVGNRFDAHFENVGAAPSPALLDLVAGFQPISISEISTGALLQGEVMACGAEFFLALRVSLDKYLTERSDLDISDFAPNDPLVHGLLRLSMQRALLEDQRQVALELARERQKSVDLLNRISRISGYIAHDFNNFLSIIRLNCDLLVRTLGEDQRALRLLEIIKGTAVRGSAITQSFMTLSHQRDDTRLPVSIDDLIRESLPFFATIVGARVSIKTSLGAGDAQILASPVGTLNCIINLLINARDAMTADGQISISTSVQKTAPSAAGGEVGDLTEFVAIEIADDGAGMDNDVLSRAFDPLFSTKPNGNGLGLASVLEFARDIGGDASIASRKGQGARINLLLPRFGPIVAGDTSGPAAGSGIANGTAELLVVDDEPFALEALCELLEFEGYRVTGCKDAAEAMAQLALKPFQILLSDIIMPGESGAILARTAQTMQPNLKVVLMSGYVPDGENLQDDWMFIRKPITTTVLSDMLRNSL